MSQAAHSIYFVKSNDDLVSLRDKLQSFAGENKIGVMRIYRRHGLKDRGHNLVTMMPETYKLMEGKIDISLFTLPNINHDQKSCTFDVRVPKELKVDEAVAQLKTKLEALAEIGMIPHGFKAEAGDGKVVVDLTGNSQEDCVKASTMIHHTRWIHPTKPLGLCVVAWKRSPRTKNRDCDPTSFGGK